MIYCKWYRASSLILLSLLFAGCGGNRERPVDRTPLASAENFKETDILPYSQGPITAGRNYVYCATFQIAWEEMQKTIASGPIKLKDDPELAVMLNEHPFDRSNLAADSYLAMGGKIEQGIVPNIRQAMQKKFPDATLAVPDPPIKAGFYVYAYLTKAVEFQEAFDRLEKPILFESKGLTTGVTAFGVEEFKESFASRSCIM